MKRASAQAHAKHAYFCTCGKIVHGNGGRAVHKAMHVRKGDGASYVTREQFYMLAGAVRG